MAREFRVDALRLRDRDAHRYLDAKERFYWDIASMVDHRARDPVLASHRTRGFTMAGYYRELLVQLAGAGKFYPVAISEVSPGAAPLLQRSGISSDGDRDVLPHVSAKGRSRCLHLLAAARVATGDGRLKSRRNSLIVLLTCFVLVQGCKHQSKSVSTLTLTHEVSPQPPRVGDVTITLELSDSAGQPVAGARITIEGNMSHAGMVPVFATATEIEPGRYRAIVQLTMAGDWIIVVQGSVRDTHEFKREFEIKGVVPE